MKSLPTARGFRKCRVQFDWKTKTEEKQQEPLDSVVNFLRLADLMMFLRLHQLIKTQLWPSRMTSVRCSAPDDPVCSRSCSKSTGPQRFSADLGMKMLLFHPSPFFLLPSLFLSLFFGLHNSNICSIALINFSNTLAAVMLQASLELRPLLHAHRAV